jgi:hypothetical protein
MIRIVIENILLFFLPAVVYVAYVWLTREDSSKGLLDDAPLVWLVIAGTVVVFTVLIAFGSTSGGRPDQRYEPPVFRDGKIEPGRVQ